MTARVNLCMRRRGQYRRDKKHTNSDVAANKSILDDKSSPIVFDPACPVYMIITSCRSSAVAAAEA